jgi:hypothetical protein
MAPGDRIRLSCAAARPERFGLAPLLLTAGSAWPGELGQASAAGLKEGGVMPHSGASHETRGTKVKTRARCLPWSRTGEAIRLFGRGITVRPCLPVAAVVGCMLSAINEGPRIAGGHAGWLTWVQIGFNFMVPFLVASYGFLTAARVPGRTPGADGAL